MDPKPGIALTSLALLSLVALAALTGGCAGPPIPAPIEGEPVCSDIEIGAAHAKMVGGLTHPVRLRILDGKNVMMKMIISGKRAPADPSSHTLLPDDNAEYVLEWAQCSNERAPRPAAHASKTRGAGKDTTAFDCGEAVVYKTDKLVTKKHDAASHAFSFPAPPKTDCWAGEGPPVSPPGAPTTTAPAAPPPNDVPAPTGTTAPRAAPSASASAALSPSGAPVVAAAPTPGPRSATAAAAPTPIPGPRAPLPEK
jgi:hypothetical protein